VCFKPFDEERLGIGSPAGPGSVLRLVKKIVPGSFDRTARVCTEFHYFSK
jgi:hypothetical protein